MNTLRQISQESIVELRKLLQLQKTSLEFVIAVVGGHQRNKKFIESINKHIEPLCLENRMRFVETESVGWFDKKVGDEVMFLFTNEKDAFDFRLQFGGDIVEVYE